MPVILVFLGIPVFFVLLTLLNGWVLSTIWQWIMVPALNAPPLSIPAAIGLSALLMLARGVPKDLDKKPDATRVLGAQLLQMGFALLVAWCAKQFL